MKKVETNHEGTGRLSKEVVAYIDKVFKPKGDLHQMEIGIHPLISNYVFERDKKIIEQERWRTLVILTRTISDDFTLNEILTSLKYKLIIEDK